MTQPLFEFGGQGRVIHLAIANGFPPETYIPLVRPLTAQYRVVCLPPRALWPDEKPPEKPGSWRSLADDLLAGLRRYNLKDIIAIGHSFGGIASMLAAIDEPHRFRALILLDPTILPRPLMEMVKMNREHWQTNNPLAAGALRRRRSFDSVGQAYDYFKQKSLFSGWPDETVRLYAESMTRPGRDGSVELAWTPEWEAYYYQSFYLDTWDQIPRLRGLLPILAVRGDTTDTFVDESARLMREELPEMAYAEIAGHGHLFPQSAPGETSRMIMEWLESLD